MVGVFGFQAIDVGEEWLDGEGIKARVDFAEIGFAQLWRKRFFFDDFGDQVAAFGFADHATVTDGVGGKRAEQGHGSVLFQVVIA